MFRARLPAASPAHLCHTDREIRLAELSAEAAALVSKAGAVSPDLVAALQAFSDRALTERVAESIAILGGDSVATVLSRLLAGTPLAASLGKEKG